MAKDDNKIILQPGVSFTKWKTSLQAKLARRNVLGHVFHNMPGLRPVHAPVDASSSNTSPEDLPNLSTEHEIKLEQWLLGENEAKNVITSRLSSSTCPQNYDHMTAKELFDAVACIRQETATALYATALETFLMIRFMTTADDYIDRLLAGIQSVNITTDALPFHAAPKRSSYHIGDGVLLGI